MARPRSLATDTAAASAVGDYKRILAEVLATRPSGTRQRLARALGKTRSFISHIANPDYPTPVPAGHVETILELCHFPPEARRRFLEAFARAHPRRPAAVCGGSRHRVLTLQVPDFGSRRKNEHFDRLLGSFVRGIGSMLADEAHPLPAETQGGQE